MPARVFLQRAQAQAQPPACLDESHTSQSPVAQNKHYEQTPKALERFRKLTSRLGWPRNTPGLSIDHSVTYKYVPLTMAEKTQLPDHVRRGLGIPEYPPFIKALFSDLPAHSTTTHNHAAKAPYVGPPMKEVSHNEDLDDSGKSWFHMPARLDILLKS